MQICFRAVAEQAPGEVWQACCKRAWPGFEDWFLQQGDAARPSYLECRTAMRKHMPELIPIWQELIELAGGGDRAARALSLWRPTPYIAGCSQAVWSRGDSFLVRNYDYHPDAFEATALHASWQGVRSVSMIDCLWGALDGVNEHGLCVALAFAGSRVVGDGFGIPLLLRYALQQCTDVPSAVALLQRLPSHMKYHVTMLDAAGRSGRLTLSPNEPAQFLATAVATNHGDPVEWQRHAKATQSIERHRVMTRALASHEEDARRFVGRFLRPPLFQLEYRRGFGTLYTALYRPAHRSVELIWPDTVWTLGVDAFVPAERLVTYQVPIKDSGAALQGRTGLHRRDA
jgi:predicted choloylglycine hydrolase